MQLAVYYAFPTSSVLNFEPAAPRVKDASTRVGEPATRTRVCLQDTHFSSSSTHPRVAAADYLLHRLLALCLDKLPRLVRHRRSDARKCMCVCEYHKRKLTSKLISISLQYQYQ